MGTTNDMVPLLKFRVIGHPLLPAAPWIEVGQGVTVLRSGRTEQAQALLRMLQTVHPPYDIHRVEPFGDLPLSVTGPAHTRRIIPAKKTAALALFAASPSLVETLALLDPVFYETGWIEVGRRRDYSRWMNFVELSGSTRWSEIAPTVQTLLALAHPSTSPAIDALRAALATWQGGERVKGARAQELLAQMRSLHPLLPREQQEQVESCCWTIERAQRFIQAKEAVAFRLPFLLAVPEITPPPFTSFLTTLRQHPKFTAGPATVVSQANQLLAARHPETPLRVRMDGETPVLIDTRSSAPLMVSEQPGVPEITTLMAGYAALHQAVCACPPLFLIDVNGLRLQERQRTDLLATLKRCSSSWQCLVAADRAFLALCAAASEQAARGEASWLRIVDLEADNTTAAHPEPR